MTRPPLRLASPSDPAGRSAPAGSPAPEDDEERLVGALREHHTWAERSVLERFTPLVRRVLVRVLGSAAELDDLTQEVFLRAMDRVDDLRAGVNLRSWFASFAVNVARETLRGRSRRRWLLFLAPQDLPEPSPPVADASVDAHRAVRATYEILGQMRIDLRTVFALRHIDGMELAELADVCGVSLTTVKRQLGKAGEIFHARARSHPALAGWTEQEP